MTSKTIFNKKFVTCLIVTIMFTITSGYLLLQSNSKPEYLIPKNWAPITETVIWADTYGGGKHNGPVMTKFKTKTGYHGIQPGGSLSIDSKVTMYIDRERGMVGSWMTVRVKNPDFQKTQVMFAISFIGMIISVIVLTVIYDENKNKFKEIRRRL
jgi:hypothetical protein